MSMSACQASNARGPCQREQSSCGTLTSAPSGLGSTAPKSAVFRAFPGEFFVPNLASAKKNMRKSRAAAVRNRAQRSALRTALKKAKAPGATAEDKKAAVQLLDRAARKGIVHKNMAARNKSKLSYQPKSGTA